MPVLCTENNNALVQQLQAEVVTLKLELAEALAEMSVSELAESTMLLKQDIRGCCLDTGGGGLMLQPQTRCLCVTK